MAHRIQDCIRDWDVEGYGDSMAAALDAIATECEKDAARLDTDAKELRKAAARFRAMREICVAHELLDEPESK